MDSANQIQALVDEVEKNPEYKISEQEAKGFLSEIKRLTKEDKTNMPPLVVIIMAYINMLFPELDEVKIWGKSIKNKIDFSSLLTYKLAPYLSLIPLAIRYVGLSDTSFSTATLVLPFCSDIFRSFVMTSFTDYIV